MIRPVSLAALILAALNVSLRAAEPIPVPMRTIATVGFNATSPVWSSNSDTIAFVERIGSAMVGNIWTVKATGGAKRLTTGGQNACPVWTPTGGLVAARVANNRWSWVTINTSTGKATPYTPNRVFTPSGRGFVPSAATFSPDGSMLAFDICATGQTMEDSGRIQILNVRKGTVSDLPVPDKSIAFNPTWSPCGKFIAYQRLPKGWYFNRTGDESYCQIWATDIKGGKTRQMTIPEKEISFGSPRWSRDGKYLAVEKWLVSMRRMTRRDTWITGITDSTTGAFLFNQGQNTGAIAWAPDSRRSPPSLPVPSTAGSRTRSKWVIYRWREGQRLSAHPCSERRWNGIAKVPEAFPQPVAGWGCGDARCARNQRRCRPGFPSVDGTVRWSWGRRGRRRTGLCEVERPHPGLG